jgi:hypothetical protein
VAVSLKKGRPAASTDDVYAEFMEFLFVVMKEPLTTIFLKIRYGRLYNVL